jgi:signal transduction histidine kinase
MTLVKDAMSGGSAHHHSTSDSITNGMTWRYVIALGLVAALSVMAYVVLKTSIQHQETSAAIINYSGKRRYTSHRAALYAVIMATTDQEKIRTDARSEMLKAISIMEQAHHGLLHGDKSLGLPGGSSPKIAAMYYSGDRPLDTLVKAYVSRVRSFADLPDAELFLSHPEVTWITTTATGELLTGLESVVAAYQHESESDIARLQWLELAVLSTTFVILGIEAWFIFRPMVHRVRQERQRLLSAEASTRAILDNSYDAIVVVSHEGIIRSANQSAVVMSQVKDSNLTGELFSRMGLLLPASFNWSKPPPGICTLAGISNDSLFDAAFTSATIADESVIIATMRESTKQLQNYARNLERRNQELDQFAYVASHDLKAPLRAIRNLGHWIVEDAGKLLPTQVNEHITLLGTRVQRLEALIDGIHSYAVASRPNGAPESIDTYRLVRDIIDEQLLGSMHERAKHFSFLIDEKLPKLIADKTRLWQVFSNLIANAIKHHSRDNGEIRVSAKAHGEYFEFSIADNGPGIDPAYHDRIFIIFQTLASKDIHNSLGLGLALVKKIVREAGGHISLDSRVGHGSVFRFTWPQNPIEPLQGMPHA